MAEGLAPGCALSFRALTEGTPDPIFHPLSANVGHFDKEMAAAAMAGRIGDNPQALAEAYRTQLRALDEVLNSCLSGAACSAGEAPPSPIFSTSKSERSTELRSSLGVASSMAESLLLEYCEGMDADRLGWGRVNLEKLRELLQLHTAAEDIAQRTSYIARAKSSNMLFHVLRSIQQAKSGRPIAGALSKPDDRLLILVGHDTNLANIAGALGLNWLVDGRRDDTPPGGALIFELWRNRRSRHYKVRTYFSAQALDQMRYAVPLSLSAPPERVPVYAPGCSDVDGACALDAFERTLKSAINPAFVK
jgi:4-phytase/acid phosphatase